MSKWRDWIDSFAYVFLLAYVVFNLAVLKIENNRMRAVIKYVSNLPAGELIDSPVYIQQMLYDSLKEDKSD